MSWAHSSNHMQRKHLTPAHPVSKSASKALLDLYDTHIFHPNMQRSRLWGHGFGTKVIQAGHQRLGLPLLQRGTTEQDPQLSLTAGMMLGAVTAAASGWQPAHPHVKQGAVHVQVPARDHFGGLPRLISPSVTPLWRLGFSFDV